MTVGQTSWCWYEPYSYGKRLTQAKTKNKLSAQDVQMGGMGTYNPYTQYNVSQQYGTDPYSPTKQNVSGTGVLIWHNP
jgi:hypothetical protein